MNNYNQQLDNLYNALDVIAKYEDGDSVYLKRNIRAEIERVELIIEQLEALSK